MNKRLATISIVGNVVLLAGLFWTRAEGEAELRDLQLAAMRGDELHVLLHAQSLAAIETPDTVDAQATADMLRAIVSANEANIEARRAAGYDPIGG